MLPCRRAVDRPEHVAVMTTVKGEVERSTSHRALRAGLRPEGPDRRPDIRAAGSRETCGFTLIELLVVIAVIAVLMAILMPALQRAREQGKRACCLSNLKHLLLAWTMYADDFDGKIVNGSASWDAGGENPWTWIQSERAPEGERSLATQGLGRLCRVHRQRPRAARSSTAQDRYPRRSASARPRSGASREVHGYPGRHSAPKMVDLDITGIDCLILDTEGRNATGYWADAHVVTDLQ